MSHASSRAARVAPRIVRPLQEFLRTETAGGVLLLAAALIALAWANLPGDSYLDAWSTDLSLDLRLLDIQATARGWVNDGLMALFFLVVGLEIKRELLTGELSGRRRAALPVAAALGGMALPAAIYAAFNAGGEGARGWGIPMATDIAFAAGIMTLAGSHAPLALRVFLLALAIADDLGAIAVIAVFYTSDLDPAWLAAAAGVIVGIVAIWRMGLRSLPLFGVASLALWLAVHESGVHATVAGVAVGFLAPLPSDAGGAIGRLEHTLHPWTSYAVIPLFALANAGIALDVSAVRDAASSSVAIGASLGLIAGKPLGILAASWIAVRTRLAALPEGVAWLQLAGAGVVAGIGFTVSIFIAEFAFDDAGRVDEAKLGILAASTLMGMAGYAILRAASARRNDASLE